MDYRMLSSEDDYLKFLEEYGWKYTKFARLRPKEYPCLLVCSEHNYSCGDSYYILFVYGNISDTYYDGDI